MKTKHIVGKIIEILKLDRSLKKDGYAADAKKTGEAIAVERARIDNIVSLPNGSTTGDAELADIRVDIYGTRHTSAGSAVREQVAGLHERIDELSAVKLSWATLYASAWEGEDSLYSQVVTIDGVTEYSKVDLLPSVEQLAIFHEKDVAFVTENEDGVVTVFAIGDKPTNDYTMQVSIIEVVA